MKDTTVVLKSGGSFSGVLEKFRPIKGYITLVGIEDDPVKFYFKDMESCITYNERINIHTIGDQDEIARAVEYCAFMKQEPSW